MHRQLIALCVSLSVEECTREHARGGRLTCDLLQSLLPLKFGRGLETYDSD